jgi:membrane protein implicated in regulation of membrane protease activity
LLQGEPGAICHEWVALPIFVSAAGFQPLGGRWWIQALGGTIVVVIALAAGYRYLHASGQVEPFALLPAGRV